MTYAELVLKHNELLIYIEAEDAEYTARMKPYQDAVKAILATLQAKLQEENLQNVKTNYGTAYLNESNGVKVDNRDEFLPFLQNSGRWDMLDARALKKPVVEYAEKNNGTPPPGITIEPFISCRIRDKSTEPT